MGSNATYRYWSKLPTSSELAYRLTNEVVTPQSRATETPVYPNLFAATWQNIFRACTTDRLRSPPRTSLNSPTYHVMQGPGASNLGCLGMGPKLSLPNPIDK